MLPEEYNDLIKGIAEAGEVALVKKGDIERYGLEIISGVNVDPENSMEEIVRDSTKHIPLISMLYLAFLRAIENRVFRVRNSEKPEEDADGAC